MECHTCLYIYIYMTYGSFSLYALVNSLYEVTYSCGHRRLKMWQGSVVCNVLADRDDWSSKE